jgi:hypothetical protein
MRREVRTIAQRQCERQALVYSVQQTKGAGDAYFFRSCQVASRKSVTVSAAWKARRP